MGAIVGRWAWTFACAAVSLIGSASDFGTPALAQVQRSGEPSQYHYPNGYRNLIQPGEHFVYYRGIRRADGKRRPAEYFGCGTIGRVRRDADIPEDTNKKNWAWYCAIEEYLPFQTPVPAKANGVFLETIPVNMWRNGVRKLPGDAYDRILALGGVRPGERGQVEAAPTPSLASVDELLIQEVAAGLMTPSSMRAEEPDGGSVSAGPHRRTKYSKVVGDRAEEIALRYVRERVVGAMKVEHVARNGQTPGWDIQSHFRRKSENSRTPDPGDHGLPRSVPASGAGARVCAFGTAWTAGAARSECLGLAALH